MRKVSYHIILTLIYCMLLLAFNIKTAKAETPSAPTLYSPSNGATVSTGKPAFDWSDVTGATYYQIIVDNNSDWSSPEIRIWNLIVPNYVPTVTLKDGKYYWTVTAYVKGAWGPWASTWTFTVKTQAISDFSITASPTSLTIKQGGLGTSIITVKSIGGFNQPVQLTASGAPSGVTITLNPQRVTPPISGYISSTLTVSVATTATPGNYTLTVRGTSGTLTHSMDLSLEITSESVRVERTLGVKAGDWIKYEYVTVVAAGGHPWVKLEVQNVEKRTVTVLWTTGVPSGASIPPGMPTYGLTVSWDIATGASPYSYFIVHANPKVGDSVKVGLPSTLYVKGETTRTYAGVSRTVVYTSYSTFGLQSTYYWDKETGVLVEHSQSMGGVEMTMKAAETNLWRAGIGGLPLWIVGAVIAIIAVATVPITVLWVKQRRISTKPEAVPSEPLAEVKYCTKCGASIPLDATYCTKCGQKQP